MDEQAGTAEARQERCPQCLTKHYQFEIESISKGEAGCGGCGYTPGVLTHDEYVAALRRGKRLAGARIV